MLGRHAVLRGRAHDHRQGDRPPRPAASWSPRSAPSFRKLDPRSLVRNPVMFVVEVVATLTTVLFLRDLLAGRAGLGFAFQITLWLWFTVLFANFAEAVAEGRGKAQADALRRTRTETQAKLLERAEGDAGTGSCRGTEPQARRRRAGRGRRHHPGRRRGDRGRGLGQRGGDHRRVRAGDPRERRRPLGRDRRHQVLSDWIKVRITAAAGSTFLDRMIAPGRGRRAAEDAERDRAQHPAGRADADLPVRGRHPPELRRPTPAAPIPVLILVALFVCLIPTTIGALLSAIGIAGMDRLVRFNVLAMSGRAVEAAGDVDTLLLDKTGTITLGNRQAAEFLPVRGRRRARARRRGAARLARRRDARRGARSWSWPRRSTACAAATWASSRPASCPSPRRRA